MDSYASRGLIAWSSTVSAQQPTKVVFAHHSEVQIMAQHLEEVINRLLGDDPSPAHIIELLSRRGFLVSVSSGFTDRHVRLYLINLLGNIGDESAFKILEAHKRLPDVLGGGLISEAAGRAISSIKARAAGIPDPPPKEPKHPNELLKTSIDSAFEMIMTPVKQPEDLEAIGIKGRALQEALLEIDDLHPLPSCHDEGMAVATLRVIDLLQETGCDDEILSKVRQLLAEPEDAEQWFDVTILLRTHGYFHGALEAYDNSVHHFPPAISSMLWSNRGLLLLSWERYAEAMASFAKALEIRPEYTRARFLLAQAYELTHDFEKAASNYLTTIEAEPENAGAWNNLGLCQGMMGHRKQAFNCYNNSIAIDPNNLDALSNLAIAYCAAGQFDDAEKIFHHIMKIDPEDPFIPRLRSAIARKEQVDHRIRETFEPRRLIRVAGKGGQSNSQAYALLSPANLAVEESPIGRGGFDEAIHAYYANTIADSRSPATNRKEVYFISYKWESPAFCHWVADFVFELQKRGYRLIFDQFESLDLRDHLADAGLQDVAFQRLDRMQREVPELVREIAKADVFMPIMTEGYRRCVDPPRLGSLPHQALDEAFPRINPEDGWVFDEWQLALRLRLRGKLRWQGVWRGGPTVPPPFVRDTVLDFRDDSHYAEALEKHFPVI